MTVQVSCGRSHRFADRNRWKREGCGLDDYRTTSTELGSRRGASSQEAEDRLTLGRASRLVVSGVVRVKSTVCTVDVVDLGCL